MRSRGPHGFRPSRQLDATGLFWCFVLLFVAAMASLLEDKPTLLTIACLLATPFSIGWQLRKWRTDSKILKSAIDWCHRYYPNETDNSILNFVLALAHDTHTDLDMVNPDSRLDELNWTLDFDVFIVDKANPHASWIGHLFYDARIKNIDTDAFVGDTLGDVIRLVVERQTGGMTIA